MRRWSSPEQSTLDEWKCAPREIPQSKRETSFCNGRHESQICFQYCTGCINPVYYISTGFRYFRLLCMHKSGKEGQLNNLTMHVCITNTSEGIEGWALNTLFSVQFRKYKLHKCIEFFIFFLLQNDSVHVNIIVICLCVLHNWLNMQQLSRMIINTRIRIFNSFPYDTMISDVSAILAKMS